MNFTEATDWRHSGVPTVDLCPEWLLGAPGGSLGEVGLLREPATNTQVTVMRLASWWRRTSEPAPIILVEDVTLWREVLEDFSGTVSYEMSLER